MSSQNDIAPSTAKNKNKRNANGGVYGTEGRAPGHVDVTRPAAAPFRFHVTICSLQSPVTLPTAIVLRQTNSDVREKNC